MPSLASFFAPTATPGGVASQVQYNGGSGFLGAPGLLTNGNQVAVGGAALSTTAAMVLAASTGSVVSLRILPGTTPTPVPGDIWTTASGLFAHIGSTTYNLISGVPGGVNTNVQFNNAGAFGGSTQFTWSDATGLTSNLPTVIATAHALRGIVNATSSAPGGLYTGVNLSASWSATAATVTVQGVRVNASQTGSDTGTTYGDLVGIDTSVYNDRTAGTSTAVLGHNVYVSVAAGSTTSTVHGLNVLVTGAGSVGDMRCFTISDQVTTVTGTRYGLIQNGAASLNYFEGKLETSQSTNARAGFRMPLGAAPGTAQIGDVWTTAAGMYLQLSSSIAGPFAGLDNVNVWTKAQVSSVVTLTDGATITPDLQASNAYTVTLGGSRTLANPTNMAAGMVGTSGRIVIRQDAGGSKTLAYDTWYKFPGGTIPVLTTTANAVDMLVYEVISTTELACQLIKDIK